MIAIRGPEKRAGRICTKRFLIGHQKGNGMRHFIDSVRLTVTNGLKYTALLENLISRELKKKYRNNILGYVWCVLNPLLVMVIMSVVFSRMFRNSITNYPVYLFTGRMVFNFIIGGAGNVMRSIVSNGPLIRKTRVPYYIFPLATFFSSVVDFLFNLVAFLIVLLFTRTPVSIHAIEFPIVILEMSVFTLGLGMILAVINLYVRDIDYVWAITTVAVTYLTPMFYPIEALSETLAHLIATFNPLYFYIAQFRMMFLNYEWIPAAEILRGFGVGAVLMLIGMVMYNKAKNTMILHV